MTEPFTYSANVSWGPTVCSTFWRPRAEKNLSELSGRSQPSGQTGLWTGKFPWCWERLRARVEGDHRGWDGWVASLTQWLWDWANSRRQWRTGRPGVLQFMGLQRVWHYLATEQQLPYWWSWPLQRLHRRKLPRSPGRVFTDIEAAFELRLEEWLRIFQGERWRGCVSGRNSRGRDTQHERTRKARGKCRLLWITELHSSKGRWSGSRDRDWLGFKGIHSMADVCTRHYPSKAHTNPRHRPLV